MKSEIFAFLALMLLTPSGCVSSDQNQFVTFYDTLVIKDEDGSVLKTEKMTTFPYTKKVNFRSFFSCLIL